MANQVKSPGSFLCNVAVSAFRGVTISTNRGIDYSATAVRPEGWTQQDKVVSDYVAVSFFGGHQTFKAAVTGTPITNGDTLFGGTDGYLTRTGGTVTAAIARESTGAGTNGAIIEVSAKF